MFRCIDCGGPVEDYMVQTVKNPETGEVDLEDLLCQSCDSSNADYSMQEYFSEEANMLSDYNEYFDYPEDEEYYNFDSTDNNFERECED